MTPFANLYKELGYAKAGSCSTWARQYVGMSFLLCTTKIITKHMDYNCYRLIRIFENKLFNGPELNVDSVTNVRY